MKKVKFGEICDIFSAGDKPKIFSEIKTEECSVPVYGNGQDLEGLVGYTNKATMYKKAVTVSARGSSCGTAFYRDEPYTPIVRLISLVAKPSFIDDEYLYYQVLNQHFRSSGSGQPQITIPQIADCEISIEDDLELQKAITKTLRKIDLKIKNNNAICSDLEAIAKLLYDYWFVQFDFPDENGKPYKSSGGKMVWNEELKREIPEGWRITTLGELFDITMGSSPKGDSLNENNEGTEFYQGSTDFGKLYPEERVYTTSPIRMAKAQDVLLSVRAPVGAMNLAMNDCCIGRGLAAIHHPSALFVWNTMKTFQPFFDVFNGNGTTFGALTSDDLKNQVTISPDKGIVDLYAQKAVSIEKDIRNRIMENRELISLRDFLLPMLMNGQVKVGKEST